MKKDRLILVSALFVFGFLGLTLAISNLNFIEPTLRDDGFLLRDSVDINVSVNNSVNNSVWLDWNNDLVGYWSFDYVNETGVFDNSSYDNFGEFKGNLTSGNITLGVRGNALNFSGLYTDYLDLKRDSEFSFWNNENDYAFTISIWVRFYDNGTDQYILSKTTSPNHKEYHLSMDVSYPRFSFELVDDSANGYIKNYCYPSSINIGEWHHVVATYNGNETKEGIKLYCDGVPSGTSGTTDGAYTAMDSREVSYLYLGRFLTYDDKEYNLSGSLDEVMIFNRSLNSEEVLSLYNHTEVYFNKTINGLNDGIYNYS
ncbi:MAG: LamG domain-containing protein, partial [Candidatus Nanoarchaeia archaeon]